MKLINKPKQKTKNNNVGVMVYISFVEIFFKSLNAYTAALGERLAPLITMLTFFGG